MQSNTVLPDMLQKKLSGYSEFSFQNNDELIF